MEDNEGLAGCLAILLIGGVLIFSASMINYWFDSWVCGRHGRIMNLETENFYWDGCYFKVNGRLVPEKSFRAVPQ